ncbi:hypothetical protein E3A20_30090, partial [Planctomyces bekefii]
IGRGEDKEEMFGEVLDLEEMG